MESPLRFKTTVIFDFDGTLVDTRMAVLEILNRLAPEYGYPVIHKDNIHAYTNKSARSFIEDDLKMSRLGLFLFVRRIKSELNKKLDAVFPVPGIGDVLRELKQRGYRTGLVSSNSEENIRMLIERNRMDFFDYVRMNSSLLGKNRNIQRLLKDKKLRKEEVIYVGDEIRDIDAARNSGIDVIAVTWGYNSKRSLQRYSPTLLIDHPKELLEHLPVRR